MSRVRTWQIGLLALTVSAAGGSVYAQKDIDDPGLIVGAELWNLQSTNLDLDVAVDSNSPPSLIDGQVLDIRMENQWRSRFRLGWSFGEKGAIVASYWAFDQARDRERPVDGDNVLSVATTLSHPLGAGTFGDGFADGVLSSANVDVRVVDLEWAYPFVRGEKFRGTWRVGARDMKFEENLSATYSTDAGTIVDDLALFEPVSDMVQQAIETTGAGVKTGFEGRYQLGAPVALRGRIDVAGLAGDTDSSFRSVNQQVDGTIIIEGMNEDPDTEFWLAGTPVTYDAIDEGENKFMLQIEAEVGVVWNVTRGWDVHAGYRVINWQDAITELRFTDATSLGGVVTQRKDFNYGGFFLGFDYRF